MEIKFFHAGLNRTVEGITIPGDRTTLGAVLDKLSEAGMSVNLGDLDVIDAVKRTTLNSADSVIEGSTVTLITSPRKSKSGGNRAIQTAFDTLRVTLIDAGLIDENDEDEDEDEDEDDSDLRSEIDSLRKEIDAIKLANSGLKVSEGNTASGLKTSMGNTTGW
jgi:hypothetical protein